MDASILAAERGVAGETYNIGGGSRIGMIEALDIVREEVGDLRVRRMPTQRGDARDTAADIGRAERDLGYAPKWSIQEGLKAQIDWHRSLIEAQVPLA